MILRKTLILTLALGILAAPVPSDAQQRSKIPRIGLLCWLTCGGPYYEAFREALRKLGYVDYKDIDFENRPAGGDRSLLDTLAADLVRLNVDIIVTDMTLAALAARHATRTTPIVMITGDPVGSGLVANPARPGGNVTGLASVVPELGAKRLELITEAIPKASRVAVLWDPTDPAMASEWRAMRVAAQGLGVTLVSVEVDANPESEGAFAGLDRVHADALVHLLGGGDPIGSPSTGRILSIAEKRRLPVIYQSREFVAAGGLMSYGANLAHLFGRAASYVDKILKGAKAADLPVEQPTRFELVVNLRTAKALGLTIPQSILIRADQVIQDGPDKDCDRIAASIGSTR